MIVRPLRLKSSTTSEAVDSNQPDQICLATNVQGAALHKWAELGRHFKVVSFVEEIAMHMGETITQGIYAQSPIRSY